MWVLGIISIIVIIVGVVFYFGGFVPFGGTDKCAKAAYDREVAWKLIFAFIGIPLALLILTAIGGG